MLLGVSGVSCRALLSLGHAAWERLRDQLNAFISAGGSRGPPVLASSATAPATTGLATDVPESFLQPVEMADPRTCDPYATTSGLTLPARSGISQRVMPREEKLAILPDQSVPPTPMTSPWSAGLLAVPKEGPSFPMADTAKASSRCLTKPDEAQRGWDTGDRVTRCLMN